MGTSEKSMGDKNEPSHSGVQIMIQPRLWSPCWVCSLAWPSPASWSPCWVCSPGLGQSSLLYWDSVISHSFPMASWPGKRMIVLTLGALRVRLSQGFGGRLPGPTNHLASWIESQNLLSTPFGQSDLLCQAGALSSNLTVCDTFSISTPHLQYGDQTTPLSQSRMPPSLDL